jgi:hypothetical protein
VPGKAYKLTGISMSDFNYKFSCRSNSEPSSIVKLQAIAVRHSNGIWEVQQEILAKIVTKTDATAVTLIKIKSKRAHCRIVGPLAGTPVSMSTRQGSVVGSHINT